MAQMDITREGFRPSYRPVRRARRISPDVQRMGIVAAGLGGVIVLALAGSALLGHHRAGVPIVEAEAGPVRIKPVDAGGMQVTGADFNPGGDANQALAPAAEQPQINALRAQLRAVKKELAHQAAETAHVEKLAETKVAAPAPVQRASALMSVPVPAPTRLPPALKPVLSGPAVQLAAFTDEAAARHDWDGLLKRAPDLLGGRRPEITPAQVAGRTMWRLRTAGFGTVNEATSFCAKMHEHGADCSIAAF